jgi:hypothetical protein
MPSSISSSSSLSSLSNDARTSSATTVDGSDHWGASHPAARSERSEGPRSEFGSYNPQRLSSGLGRFLERAKLLRDTGAVAARLGSQGARVITRAAEDYETNRGASAGDIAEIVNFAVDACRTLKSQLAHTAERAAEIDQSKPRGPMDEFKAQARKEKRLEYGRKFLDTLQQMIQIRQEASEFTKQITTGTPAQ